AARWPQGIERRLPGGGHLLGNAPGKRLLATISEGDLALFKGAELNGAERDGDDVAEALGAVVRVFAGIFEDSGDAAEVTRDLLAGVFELVGDALTPPLVEVDAGEAGGVFGLNPVVEEAL